MKLLSSPYSPFARQARVVALERGLALEVVDLQTSPVAPSAELKAHNPAAKLPALVLRDGTTLYDSRVIVDYLDALPGGPRLVPGPGDDRRPLVLTLQSLANALLDAAVLLRYETFLRPEALRWPEWIAGQRGKIAASLDALEHGWGAHLVAHFDAGAIAVACALGYLDLRFPDLGWREQRPALTRWYEAQAVRPSMTATRPPPA